MDKKETLQILSILQAAYPKFYMSQTDEGLQAAAQLWIEMFSDTPAPVVGMAIKALISTFKFPPTIADVNEYIQKLTQPPQMTGLEAWALVRKAVLNTGDWNAPAEFEKLPPLIQKIVGSPGQLKSWAMENGGVFETVTQSNFIRSFEARQKSTREYDRFPEQVKTFISQLSDGMGIDNPRKQIKAWKNKSTKMIGG